MCQCGVFQQTTLIMKFWGWLYCHITFVVVTTAINGTRIHMYVMVVLFPFIPLSIKGAITMTIIRSLTNELLAVWAEDSSSSASCRK